MPAAPHAPTTASGEHEWHGWAIEARLAARSLHIGPMPGRKSICLYEQQGGRIRVYAYFRDEQAALDARALMDYLTGYPCGVLPWETYAPPEPIAARAHDAHQQQQGEEGERG